MSTLEIVFKGQDGVGSIVNNITAEFNTLNDTTNNAKESGTGFFSGMLQTAAGFLTANVIGGITSQFTSFIGSAISDSREANQIMAQTEAAIKSTGGAAGVTAEQVADMAGQFSAAQGMSLFDDDDIQKADNLLLTFTNITDTLPMATGTLVDMATAMHQDVSSGAIQLGKALNDPEKGITALTKVGVTFTDQQKDQIKALQEAGDMAGAQTIILNELNKEFGGSAAAAAKADGGMAQFKAQLGDVGKEIGGVLLPIIGELVSFATTNLIPILKVAADWFKDHLPAAIENLKETLGPLVNAVEGIFGAFQELGPFSDEFAESLGGVASALGFTAGQVDLLEKVVFTIQDAFAPGGEAADGFGKKINDLASIWAALQPVIVNVANAIGEVVNAVFGQIQEFLSAHGEEISAVMEDAWNRIMVIIKLGIELYNAIVPPVLKAIAAFINSHGKEIQALLTTSWNSIKATIDLALTFIEGVIRVALDLIHGNWSQAWEDLKTMSARIVTDLGTIIKGGLDTVVTVFGGTWTKIKDGVGTFITVTIPGLGKAIIDGLISAVTNGSSALASAIWQMIKDAVASAIASLGGGGGGSSTGSSLKSSKVLPSNTSGFASSTNNTEMNAKVNIYTQPAQNPTQVARASLNMMNRDMKLRRA